MTNGFVAVYLCFCVMLRVAVVWPDHRRVAVYPGGALSDPAGWMRTLLTLQMHQSLSFLAKSAEFSSL